MYRIKVLTRGTNDNVEIGERYAIFTSEAVNLVTFFTKLGCELELTKFTRIHFGVYCWSKCMSDRFNKKLFYKLSKNGI